MSSLIQRINDIVQWQYIENDNTANGNNGTMYRRNEFLC